MNYKSGKLYDIVGYIKINPHINLKDNEVKLYHSYPDVDPEDLERGIIYTKEVDVKIDKYKIPKETTSETNIGGIIVPEYSSQKDPEHAFKERAFILKQILTNKIKRLRVLKELDIAEDSLHMLKDMVNLGILTIKRSRYDLTKDNSKFVLLIGPKYSIHLSNQEMFNDMGFDVVIDDAFENEAYLLVVIKDKEDQFNKYASSITLVSKEDFSKDESGFELEEIPSEFGIYTYGEVIKINFLNK